MDRNFKWLIIQMFYIKDFTSYCTVVLQGSAVTPFQTVWENFKMMKFIFLNQLWNNIFGRVRLTIDMKVLSKIILRYISQIKSFIICVIINFSNYLSNTIHTVSVWLTISIQEKANDSYLTLTPSHSRSNTFNEWFAVVVLFVCKYSISTAKMQLLTDFIMYYTIVYKILSISLLCKSGLPDASPIFAACICIPITITKQFSSKEMKHMIFFISQGNW